MEVMDGLGRMGRKCGRFWSAALPIALILLFTTACDSLLDVGPNPNTVPASEPAPLGETLIGVESSLYKSYDSFIAWGGLFGDLMNEVGTAPSIIAYDQRMVSTDHGGGGSRTRSIGGGFYTPLQQAVFVANNTQQRILNEEFGSIADPGNSPEFARVSLYEGLAKTWLADLYCKLIFGDLDRVVTAEEAYRLAEEEFTKAIEATNVTEQVRQAALVGRARVRLNVGDREGALADAQQVAPGFEMLATYSTNSFAQRNRVQFRTWDWSNFSIGQHFVGLTIDDTGISDPRVELAKNPSPAREPTLDLYAPLKVPSPSSPLRLATGDEAQYIIAEIEGGDKAVDIINEIRARKGIEESWSPSGDDPNEIRNKVIDERKRTLFLDGVRLGDIRRYLRQYDLNFFETEIPIGLPVGDQTCLPLPSVERNNNDDV